MRKDLDKKNQRLVFTSDFLLSSNRTLDQSPELFKGVDDYGHLTLIQEKKNEENYGSLKQKLKKTFFHVASLRLSPERFFFKADIIK